MSNARDAIRAVHNINAASQHAGNLLALARVALVAGAVAMVASFVVASGNDHTTYLLLGVLAFVGGTALWAILRAAGIALDLAVDRAMAARAEAGPPAPHRPDPRHN